MSRIHRSDFHDVHDIRCLNSLHRMHDTRYISKFLYRKLIDVYRMIQPDWSNLIYA